MQTETNIKTSSGTTITIIGEDSTEVAHIVGIIGNYELEKKEYEERLENKRRTRKEGNKNFDETDISLTEFLRMKIDEGYFKTKRLTSEVMRLLDAEGISRPISTVYPTLLSLVNQGILIKEKSEDGRKWVYFSKIKKEESNKKL